MNCLAPSKRMGYTSKYGYIIEQASIVSSITPLIQHDANHIPNVLNMQFQMSNILSSVSDNATMFQRSHASTAINNTSSGGLLSQRAPQPENEEDNHSSTSFSPFEHDDFIPGDELHNEGETAVTIPTTLNNNHELSASTDSTTSNDQISFSTLSQRYTSSEYAGIKLWNILDKSNAPKGLYDEICAFVRSTNSKDLMHMPSSTSLMKDVIERIQTGHTTYYPNRVTLSLPSNNTCAITFLISIASYLHF